MDGQKSSKKCQLCAAILHHMWWTGHSRWCSAQRRTHCCSWRNETWDEKLCMGHMLELKQPWSDQINAYSGPAWLQTSNSSFKDVKPAEHLTLHKTNRKSRNTPSWSREKVGADLFQWENKQYLIILCCFSNFWEIDRLHVTDSKAFIKELKAQFAKHGIPNELVSDNGPQFASTDFRPFSQEWDFEHSTISPCHKKANSMVESAIKSEKCLLNKTKIAPSDP